MRAAPLNAKPVHCVKWRTGSSSSDTSRCAEARPAEPRRRRRDAVRRRLGRVVVADVGDVASGDRRIVDYAYQMVGFEDTAGNGPLFFSGQLREHFFEVQVGRDSKQS